MEKTKYVFDIHSNSEAINQVMQNYLNKYKFTKVDNPNVNLYYTNAKSKKNRCLEYYINNNRLTLLTYLNTYECPIGLYNDMNSIKNEYIRTLYSMFKELKKIDTGLEDGSDSIDEQKELLNQNNDDVQTQSLDFYLDKKEKNDIKFSSCGLLGSIVLFIDTIITLKISNPFWMDSLWGFIMGLSMLGIIIEAVIIGLQTKKKGIAILAIIFTVLSFILSIYQILR